MLFHILLLRSFPWMTSIVSAGLIAWQWNHGTTYPWPLVICLLLYLVTATLIGWKRLTIWEMLEKLSPSVLTLSAIALSFLLMESSFERLLISTIFIGAMLLVLELLFLLAHDAPHYPVNGLSRVNITLVPVGAFYLAFTMAGLLTFIRIPWWVSLVTFALYTSLVYWFTCHPMADYVHRRRWLMFGGCVGVHIGLLTILMPVGMAVHGAIAAFLVAFPLRVRRYAFQPVPSRRLAMTESILGLVGLFSLLLVSRWA